MLKAVEEQSYAKHAPPVAFASREEADRFVETVKAAGYEYVRFELADMAGLSRGKTIPMPMSRATCARV